MIFLVKHTGLFVRQPNGRTSLKYFSKTIAGDRFKPLAGNTLTGRFLLYLNNFNSIEEPAKLDSCSLINTLKYHPRDVVKLETTGVVKALTLLPDRKFVQNKQDYTKLLNLIDGECCDRLASQDVTGIIRLLHSFMSANPNRLTETRYFSLALDDLIKTCDKLSKNELVQVIFFIGLLKKCSKAQYMLRICLNKFNKQFINELTQEDLCIICNSTFKTSTKIKNKGLLEKVKCHISQNLFILNDPAIFVTLIKTLRHNRYQDEDLLNTITCTMFFNKTINDYSFTAISHVLALYSDYLYHHETVLKILSEESIRKLKSNQYKAKDTYLIDQPRTKDIKRFLWALSNLNYKLAKEDIETVIIPQIVNRIKSGECENNPGSFVDIALYLWMMHYKAYNLIKHVLTKENISVMRATNPTSIRSMNLLLVCIFYEDAELYTSLNLCPDNRNNYDMNIQLQKRPLLNEIMANLKLISLENHIDKYQSQCQVPYINIIGITGYHKKVYKSINIEILDDYTCLKNTDSLPTGLMELKLRILEKCDEALITIEASDVIDCNNNELQEILKDEVSLVC
ncbi:uncharacterized protein LOC115890246 isoform X2 [Sitophilus oryzae]|uniref:Uncharacterized protein LOC115890246 isoform X2 n=1 Tax=Sitophilus oryzae TaxID=7048 RepID=A0A6J2YSR4_SITOR|nr:uncharacterized protein LOC115890246 isoform X2 [Sitophilus oryzae]